MFQRDDLGNTIPSSNYPKIPNAELFQSPKGYGYEKPVQVHGWEWSGTFGRWSAKVTFSDGWSGWTYPKPF